MHRRTKYVALVTVFVAVVGIGLVLFQVWRTVREEGYMSCVASMPDYVLRQSAVRDWAVQNRQWKILDDVKVRIAMEKFKGDCSRFDNPILDLQGNRINIAVRSTTGRLEAVVWSSGRDGISGTDDDVVMPYGHDVPK